MMGVAAVRLPSTDDERIILSGSYGCHDHVGTVTWIDGHRHTARLIRGSFSGMKTERTTKTNARERSEQVRASYIQ